MNVEFFTDRDLGKKFPTILSDAGIVVHKHADHFRDDEADEVWLRKTAGWGWYALSHNKRIRYTHRQKLAVIESRAGLFILVGKATFPELAENFIATHGKVIDFIRNTRRPFIAKIFRPEKRKLISKRPGRVELWYP